MLQEIRHAGRTLLRARGFTLGAVITLALGIGASSAVFSVVNTILLKPLPYRDAKRIVIPWKLPAKFANFDYPVYPWSPAEVRITGKLPAFRYFGVFKAGSFNLTGAGDPVLLKGLRVSFGFFPSLGVSPVLGRYFTEAEDQPGDEHEVMLSENLWRDRFHADPGILSRTLLLDGVPHVIVGVMPDGFAFPRPEEMPSFMALPRETQLWVPLAVPPVHGNKPEPSELASVARLAPGWTLQRAQAEMDADFTGVRERQYPAYKGSFNARIWPLEEQLTGDSRRPLMLILGAVGVVLLIATSNVANLLLARSLGRRREFAIRAALGASGRRFARQLLTESLLLALAAGSCGLLLAQAGVKLVKWAGPANLTRLQAVSLDWRVFGFALAISIATGFLFGVAPILAASRTDLAEALKESGIRATGSRGQARLRGALVIGEVALALLLVIATGLLTRTVREMVSANPGFQAAHVLTFELSLPSVKYPDQSHMAALYMRAVESLRSQPGVAAAGIGQVVPMGGPSDSTTFAVTGRPPTANRDERPYADYSLVTPGYFAALSVPVIEGRDVLETDTVDSLRVVLINRSMAKRYFPHEDPIGKQVDFLPSFPPMTIVGVVADVKQESLRETPVAHMYAPFTQRTWTPMQTVQAAVRTNADSAAAAAHIRDAIRAVDPELPAANMKTLTALIDDSMSQPRFAMTLLAVFGGLALALALIGLYGVISYAVAQRTQEIGIRVAVGARRADVFRMVIAQGARLVGAGILIGGAAAFALTRLMASFLYGVQPADPATFGAVAVLMAAVGLMACCLPARRATQVDPITALRHD